ncbi:MAG: 3-hydroxy-3-methylglutaryl-CoA reductase [Candidatus Micrarchaeota archaeon]|nr:3-hydroxy-3-methylglutaryl-CoA reductase [Candidatus Micrarchaeota archaeon]
MSEDEKILYAAKEGNLDGKGKGTLTKCQNKPDINVPTLENHLCWFPMSEGLLPKIVVNGATKVVPMVLEEPSVRAGVANAAKMAEKHGGFKADEKFPGQSTYTRGQVEIVNVPPEKIPEKMEEIRKSITLLKGLADARTPHLVAAGGGLVSLVPKIVDTEAGPQLIVDFVADTKDAMGANAVSKMAEGMAAKIAELTGGEAIARILSNLPIERTIVVTATFDKESLTLEKEVNGVMVKIPGEVMVDKIYREAAWARKDQFRATTHNKGIMNGITPVATALGQDTRAIEAGAHSYAAYPRDGESGYRSLSKFWKDGDGNLVGQLEVPIAVGVIGSAIELNDIVSANLKMVLNGCHPKVPKTTYVAFIMAAVGLAQNLAALRMLAGEGITQGHIAQDPLRSKQINNEIPGLVRDKDNSASSTKHSPQNGDSSEAKKEDTLLDDPEEYGANTIFG